jgi:hypothetical protein
LSCNGCEGVIIESESCSPSSSSARFVGGVLGSWCWVLIVVWPVLILVAVGDVASDRDDRFSISCATTRIQL